jgi:hypothetical protein
MNDLEATILSAFLYTCRDLKIVSSYLGNEIWFGMRSSDRFYAYE